MVVPEHSIQYILSHNFRLLDWFRCLPFRHTPFAWTRNWGFQPPFKVVFLHKTEKLSQKWISHFRERGDEGGGIAKGQLTQPLILGTHNKSATIKKRQIQTIQKKWRSFFIICSVKNLRWGGGEWGMVGEKVFPTALFLPSVAFAYPPPPECKKGHFFRSPNWGLRRGGGSVKKQAVPHNSPSP